MWRLYRFAILSREDRPGFLAQVPPNLAMVPSAACRVHAEDWECARNGQDGFARDDTRTDIDKMVTDAEGWPRRGETG